MDSPGRWWPVWKLSKQRCGCAVKMFFSTHIMGWGICKKTFIVHAYSYSLPKAKHLTFWTWKCHIALWKSAIMEHTQEEYAHSFLQVHIIYIHSALKEELSLKCIGLNKSLSLVHLKVSFLLPETGGFLCSLTSFPNETKYIFPNTNTKKIGCFAVVSITNVVQTTEC